MRPCSFAFFSVLAAASLDSAAARGQACCAGATALSPSRLALYEDVLVGVEARATTFYGSLDARGRLRAAPAGTAEIVLEQNLVAAARVQRRGQIFLILPFVETYRAAAGGRAFGGGVSDVRLGARYDFTTAGLRSAMPGLALAASLILPTGRTVESARTPLAVDATGAGSFAVSLAAQLEHAIRHLWFNLTAAGTWRSARAGAILIQPGAALLLSGAVGLAFADEIAIALSLVFNDELASWIGGVRAPGAERQWLRVSLSGGAPIGDAWRGQAALFADMPGLGRNQPTGAGVALMLMRVW